MVVAMALIHHDWYISGFLFVFFCCDKELDTCNLKRENSSWLQFRIYSPQRQEALGAGNRGSWSYTLAVKNQHVMSAGFLLDFSFFMQYRTPSHRRGLPTCGVGLIPSQTYPEIYLPG